MRLCGVGLYWGFNVKIYGVRATVRLVLVSDAFRADTEPRHEKVDTKRVGKI